MFNISLLFITSILFASNVQEEINTVVTKKVLTQFKITGYHPTTQIFKFRPKEVHFRFKFVRLVKPLPCQGSEKQIAKCIKIEDLTPENYFPELLMKVGAKVVCVVWGENVMPFKQINMMQTFVQCGNEIFVLDSFVLKEKE